jgi:hydroxymethylpyrimidine/phosphomethylpyrimidine kinase
VTLTIAGSDSGGGAGVQADLKTMEAHGAFGTSVVTSVTAQNTRGVESTHVLPVEEIEAQYDAVVSDFDVRAVKTGMLATAEVVRTVAERVRDLDVPVVVDPVMVAASGDRLLAPEAESAYEELLAAATLVTPNADEATVLTGVQLGAETAGDREAKMREAGERLVEMGAEAALVKGGHIAGETVRDVLVTAGGDTGSDSSHAETFTHPRIDTEATHGSGCTLSSAIAAGLAVREADSHERGGLSAVVADATAFMERAVRYSLDVGQGPGAVHHTVDLRNRAARDATREAAETVLQQFVSADVSAVVPEVGMNVVAATPYAEAPEETAAVEGRITRTLSGVQAGRGVRFGASSHIARFLLTAREFDPDLQFAVNCRFDETVETVMTDLGWNTVELDRSAEPDPDVEGSTMGWAAQQAFERADGTPDAVYDYGDVGKEPMVRVVGTDGDEIAEKVLALCAEFEEQVESLG